MFNRILVCFDGSETSAEALLMALRVAALHDAELRIVHALEHAPLPGGHGADGGPGQPSLERARAHARDILCGALETASLDGRRVQVRLLETGARNLGETIAAQARSWGADLVVVGSQGRRGIARALLGSGAEQIIRLAPVPVLVVRPPAHAPRAS